MKTVPKSIDHFWKRQNGERKEEPAQTPAREPLDPAGAELLSRLPPELLTQTANRYPHVLNRLGALWWTPEEFDKALESMILDERQTRAGFPLGVIGELTNLREHYATHVAERFYRPSDLAAAWHGAVNKNRRR